MRKKTITIIFNHSSTEFRNCDGIREDLIDGDVNKKSFYQEDIVIGPKSDLDGRDMDTGLKYKDQKESLGLAVLVNLNLGERNYKSVQRKSELYRHIKKIK